MRKLMVAAALAATLYAAAAAVISMALGAANAVQATIERQAAAIEDAAR